MPGRLQAWLADQVRSRISSLATVVAVTLRPSAFAETLRDSPPPLLRDALKYFLRCVGIVLAIEALFSFAFRTEFSDLVHHAAPILVVLAAAVAVHLVLRVLLTPGVSLARTASATLLVGGAGLVVTIALAFLLLGIDFLASYEAVRTSPCRHRTIICLASGGSRIDYDVPHTATGTLGLSIPLILLLSLALIVHYCRALALVLRAVSGVAPWRSLVAAGVSIVALAPPSLAAVNALYRWLYGT